MARVSFDSRRRSGDGGTATPAVRVNQANRSCHVPGFLSKSASMYFGFLEKEKEPGMFGTQHLHIMPVCLCATGGVMMGGLRRGLDPQGSLRRKKLNANGHLNNMTSKGTRLRIT